MTNAPLDPTNPTGQRKHAISEISNDSKRWGDLAELAFVFKVTSLGITASRPFGDRRPYDFLVECGQRLWRIQVKSVFTQQSGAGRCGYPVSVSQNRRRGRQNYTAAEIDFIAAFVAPQATWYLIPVGVIGTLKIARLYPAGTKRKNTGRFEQYREAWELLR